EGCDGVRIGNPLALRGIVKPCEAGEFVPSALRNRFRQIFFKIAKEEERGHRTKLFAHEEKRRRRRHQQDRHRNSNCASIAKRDDSLSESAISDLIVILEKRNKR